METGVFLRRGFFCGFWIFSFFLTMAFFSCKHFSENFGKDMRTWFLENTEGASVVDFSFANSEELLVDAQGFLSAPSDKDLEATLILRNPQNYEFLREKNMKISPAWNEERIALELGIVPDWEGGVFAIQESDKTKILLRFSKNFLQEVEGGIEISPVISLFHPVSQVPFEPFSKIKLKCNTPPPLLYGPVLYKTDEGGGFYVLAFNVPSERVLSGIHKDAKKIQVEAFLSSGQKILSESCEIQIDADGIFSFLENANFKKENILQTGFFPISAEFSENGQCAYFVSNAELGQGEVSFEISLFDKAGLSSSSRVGANILRLKNVSVFANDAEIVSGSEIPQEKGKTQAKITISAQENGAKIFYEIFSGENDSFPIFSSGSKIEKVEISLPFGNYFLRAYSSLEGFADSLTSEINFSVAQNLAFVSGSGDDENGFGTEENPFLTIKKATESFTQKSNEKNCVSLLSDLHEEVSISNSDLAFKINGNEKNLFGKILLDAKSIALSNLTIEESCEFSLAEKIILEKTKIKSAKINSQKIEIENSQIQEKILLEKQDAQILLSGNCEIQKIEFGKSGAVLILGEKFANTKTQINFADENLLLDYEGKSILKKSGGITDKDVAQFTLGENSDYEIVIVNGEGVLQKIKSIGDGNVGVLFYEMETEISVSSPSNPSNAKLEGKTISILKGTNVTITAIATRITRKDDGSENRETPYDDAEITLGIFDADECEMQTSTAKSIEILSEITSYPGTIYRLYVDCKDPKSDATNRDTYAIKIIE